MYEIKVLPLNYPSKKKKRKFFSDILHIIIKIKKKKGQYSDLNREPIVPQTIALPIKLYYP
jgi:hypothetical protein